MWQVPNKIRLGAAKLWGRCRDDPKFVFKYIAVTLAIGAVDKTILVSFVDYVYSNKIVGQFSPTLIMLYPTFLVHKWVWGHREAKFWSYIGSSWSQAYLVAFLFGHSVYFICVLWLQWYYLGVSIVTGGIVAFFFYVINELRIFRQKNGKTE